MFGSELEQFKLLSIESFVTRRLKTISKDTLLSLSKLKEPHDEDIEEAFRENSRRLD